MTEEWKLKILSGLHQGAEVPLAYGNFALGSDDLTADLVIADIDINPIQCHIYVNKSGVHLSRVAPGVKITIGGVVSTDSSASELNEDAAGAAESGSPSSTPEDSDTGGEVGTPASEPSGLVLPEQTLVEVGPLHFAIAPVADEWEEFPSPDSLTESGPASPKADSSQVKQQSASQLSRASSSKGVVIGVLICVLPIVGLMWGLVYKQDQDVLEQNRKIKALQKVESLIRENQLRDLSVKWKPGTEQLLFEGYVISHQQKKQLFEGVEKIGYKYQSQVKVMEDIAENVRVLLKNMEYSDFLVEPATAAGSVNITGVIEDRANWERVESILAQDVPGLLSWALIDPAGSPYNHLQAMLKETGLLDKLTLTDSGEEIVAKGPLSDPEVAVFNQVKALFQQKYGNDTLITLQLVSRVDKTADLHFPVRSVSLGTVPFVILTDAQKYIEGALVSNGYRILHIGRDRIELGKNNQVISIKIGDKNDNTERRAGSSFTDSSGRKTASR